MALTFDVSNIENYEEVTTAYRDPRPSEGDGAETNADGKIEIWHPVTETIIYSCMFLGMQAITEKNLATFQARMDLYQSIHGPLMQGRDEETGKIEPVRVTDEDVARHVGLTTNATDETDAAWLKRIVKVDYDRLKDRKQRAINETTEKAEA